jgi:ABC-type multidrug transport system fused ATPase/permease subunit
MHKTIQLLTRIIKQGRSYIPFFIAQGLIGFISMPLDLYGLFLFRKLIDKGFLLQDWQTTKNILLILLALFVIRSVSTFGASLFFSKIKLRMNQYFQNMLFSHILYLPVRFFSREPTGQLMSRLFSDSTLFANIFSLIFNKILLSPIKLLVLLLVLAYFNLQLCILMTAASLFSIFIIQRMGFKLDLVSKEFQNQNAAAFSYLEQILSNIELIKIKATETKTATTFTHILTELIGISVRTLKISLVSQWILQSLTFLAMGVAFVYGSWLVSKGVLTIGTLATFLGIAYLFFNTILSLSNDYGSLRETLARFEILFSILDTHPEKPQPQVNPNSTLRIESVEFCKVNFSYEIKRPVLNDITFTLKRGQTVGITGQSGSGKTTLMRLLARFYEPDEGEIQINGESLHEMDPHSLRSAMGIVFQENLILPDTIYNNIGYGNQTLSETAIIAVARISQIHDFIQSLPHRYESMIGEGGKGLSGGQRQRLAIARALVSDPEILILDEATSFIEVDQEMKILQKIKETRKEKITVIISHRLSAIRLSDRILTLDNGVLIETDFKSLVKTL